MKGIARLVLLHCGIFDPSMTAMGRKQTQRHHGAMSALPPKADTATSTIPSPTLGERRHRGLARRRVPARGSSTADHTTKYIPYHSPSLQTDSIANSHRAPTT